MQKLTSLPRPTEQRKVEKLLLQLAKIKLNLAANVEGSNALKTA